MTQLISAALFFLVLHFGIAGTPLRKRLIAIAGEKIYRAVFSAASLAGLFWLAHAYRTAGYMETWGQLSWFKPLAAGLVLIAFVFIVLGVTTPNPTAVDGEKLLEQRDPAAGILRVTRHPMLWGIALWALAHVIANGDLASLILFGSLLALVLVGMISIDAKRKNACGESWERFAAVTSVIPFVAIGQGRNRLAWNEFKGWQVFLAVLLYALMMHFHKALFGVAPLAF